MGAFDILIFALMLATLAVLVMGVIGMMRGNDSNKSNRLMSMRVGFQAAVVLLLGLMFMMGKH